jgi:hypothetical protein
MKLLRLALLALCVLGLAACAYASARLAGWVPPGKLPLYPPWTVAHFISASAFLVVVPLQLWPRLRRSRPGLHRMFGRGCIALGAVMAASGIAMAYASPDRPVSERIFMTSLFVAYAAMLGLGFRAALARDFAAHRAWMLRMTATALTPITQRIIFPVFAATIGVDGRETFWQLFIAAAWLAWGTNMTVTEAWLGKGAAPQARAAQA